MMSTSEAEHEIEIEKKFAVNDKTAAVLKSYGFEVVQNEEFVDWYDKFSGLKVDIDKADSGYMVGEVEALLSDGLSSQTDVENEKEKIRQFVDLIMLDSECNAKATTIGKLEFVLMKERPNLYHDCVKAGVINEPK